MADDELELNEPAEDIEAAPPLSRDDTRRALHALLFVSDKPLSPARLAEAIGDIDPDMVEVLLNELRADVEQSNLPYELREIAGGFQFTSLPEFGPYIRRLLQIKQSTKLSKAVLETLAIVAYKQPVTRAEVEAIRGVSVSHAFEILQEKRLVKVAGVAEVPGRPRLYRTTDEFLVHFGLKSLKDLPSIEELRDMARNG